MLNEHLFNPYLNVAFDKPDDDGAGADTPEGSDTDDNVVMPDADAEALRKEVSKLRSESAKYRTRSKEHDSVKKELDDFKKGLKGLFGENEEVDPEKLKARTESLETELANERKKNAVAMQAMSKGLDADLTIAYLQNQGKLKDLDTSDNEAVSTLIETVSKEKPGLIIKGADSVGTGGSGNDDTTKEGENLNPIDAYRKKVGILANKK